MTSTTSASLCDPVLTTLQVEHGFGCRGSRVPDPTRFPRQVHGATICRAKPLGTDTGAGAAIEEPLDADAILTSHPQMPVGIVTADCVPILASTGDGRAVAAIHAGWRGLAAGVIEWALEALRDAAPGIPISAAIGPCARGCCYEIDEPVRRALARRYSGALAGGVLEPVRPGHFLLDLGGLAERVMIGSGIARERLGIAHRVCTICDAARFESHRRDGPAAGRLRHFITARDGRANEAV